MFFKGGYFGSNFIPSIVSVTHMGTILGLIVLFGIIYFPPNLLLTTSCSAATENLLFGTNEIQMEKARRTMGFEHLISKFLIRDFKFARFIGGRQNDFLISSKYPAHSLHLLSTSVVVVGFFERDSTFQYSRPALSNRDTMPISHII